jgi:endonuclease V-like protein UPF0215 family
MQLDEEHDDVKLSYQPKLVAYKYRPQAHELNDALLESLSIRDKQIKENKQLECEWVEEQKRLDIMLEIERLKGLKVAEEREIIRQQAQRKVATVIFD